MTCTIEKTNSSESTLAKTDVNEKIQTEIMNKISCLHNRVDELEIECEVCGWKSDWLYEMLDFLPTLCENIQKKIDDGREEMNTHR